MARGVRVLYETTMLGCSDGQTIGYSYLIRLIEELKSFRIVGKHVLVKQPRDLPRVLRNKRCSCLDYGNC
jgi:hypothetical protein